MEKDLFQAQNKLRKAEKQVEEIASQQSKWEHEMLLLRQKLQTSATKDMKYGIHQSVETLHIEAELGHVQQKATKLATKRAEIIAEMQGWMPRQSDQQSYQNVGYQNDNAFNGQERPKTVRMVKRDSKDRFRSPTGYNGEEMVPNLLPRGQNGHNNVHDFLNDDLKNHENYLNQLKEDEKSDESLVISKSSTLPRSFKSDDLKDLKSNGPVYSSLVKPSMIHGYKRKVIFQLIQYFFGNCYDFLYGQDF